MAPAHASDMIPFSPTDTSFPSMYRNIITLGTWPHVYDCVLLYEFMSTFPHNRPPPIPFVNKTLKVVWRSLFWSALFQSLETAFKHMQTKHLSIFLWAKVLYMLIKPTWEPLPLHHLPTLSPKSDLSMEAQFVFMWKIESSNLQRVYIIIASCRVV